MDPHATLTPPTVALRAEARRVQRRGIGLILVILCSFVHFYRNDHWWDTPEGAVAYVAGSVLLVVAATLLARIWFAALVLAHQVYWVLILLSVGEIYTAWHRSPLVIHEVWSRGETRDVEPESRLYVRRAETHLWSGHGSQRYVDAQAFVDTLVARTAVRFLGPPPRNYQGPLPTEAEARVLVTGAPTLEPTLGALEGTINAVSPLHDDDRPEEIVWRSPGPVAVVQLGGGGVLVSWGDGAVIDLYDAASRWKVTTWTRDGHVVPSTRSRAATRGDNALWLRRRWLHTPTTEAEVAELQRSVRAHDIGTLYPFVGPMRPGGRFGWRDGDRLREYDPELARTFFERVHRTAPAASARGLWPDFAKARLEVYPWTGGVLGKDAFPEDPLWRAEFVEQARALVALGADGVHVNIEPMPEATRGYLDLLRELSAALDGHVSVAAYPPPTPLHPFPDIHWSTDFLRLVCEIAEDVSVMTYDTALEDPKAYSDLMSTWTREIATALAPLSVGPDTRRTGCRWRLGIPTYDDDAPWHRPDAETLSAALDGVIAGYEVEHRSAALPGFSGLALYASWTTTSDEWAEFDWRWRQQAPVEVRQVDEGD